MARKIFILMTLAAVVFSLLASQQGAGVMAQIPDTGVSKPKPFTATETEWKPQTSNKDVLPGFIRPEKTVTLTILKTAQNQNGGIDCVFHLEGASLPTPFVGDFNTLGGNDYSLEGQTLWSSQASIVSLINYLAFPQDFRPAMVEELPHHKVQALFYPVIFQEGGPAEYTQPWSRILTVTGERALPLGSGLVENYMNLTLTLDVPREPSMVKSIEDEGWLARIRVSDILERNIFWNYPEMIRKGVGDRQIFFPGDTFRIFPGNTVSP